MSRSSPRPFAFTGEGALAGLSDAILRDTQLAFLVLRPDGTVVFVNEAMAELIGRRPDECIGHNAVEWIHPESVERAAALMELSRTEGSPPGMSRFFVSHNDGTWIPVEIAGAGVSAGGERLLAIYARNGRPRLAIEQVMALLLHAVPLPDVLLHVCDVIEWNNYGSHVAISWNLHGGYEQVSTGVPDELGGGDGDPRSPWARCRADRRGILGKLADLDGRRRQIAADHDVTEFWIEPVDWDESYPPATITIWTTGLGRGPRVHSYGMEVARNMVELIMRWSAQQTSLESAAHIDPLTGLANRRVFFEALSGQTAGGAVLYCDLDRFKPVNDALGHAAGDELLRGVAQRIAGSVRSDDLIARIGGDEFAVICRGASVEVAMEVAVRIERALEDPFEVRGELVKLGVSIGIAHSADGITEALVDAADRALVEAKAAGRSTHRVADR